MRLAVVENDFSADKLDFLKAVGVNHLCGSNDRDFGFEKLGYWDAELLADAKKHVEAHGIKLDMLTLPLTSVGVDRVALPNIICATPERDAEIERFIKCIRAAAKAGIPSVKYNFVVGPVLRTEPAVGRAGAIHTAFDYSKFKFVPTRAGIISAEEMWARISYLVDKFLPVIEELGMRISCHPHDPAMPKGVGLDDRVMGDIDGLKKYMALSDSLLYGLTYCQGCVEESGATQQEVLDSIRFFGRRIFMVHFRTIVGGYLNFREAFVDEGDIDMLEAMKAYQANTPDHNLLVPDHYPKIPGDTPWGHQSKAYAIGYIKALMRATGGETD
ncbi:MAG: mannonate dehydratase [Chloroflexi bacterium]|nr:mannonate dehydratase [Chloroflexota bacterium]